MDRQEPSQVLLGDYDISQRCDCLESLCAPLPQEVISINLSIYLSLHQSISLSIYLSFNLSLFQSISIDLIDTVIVIDLLKERK